MHTAIGSVLVTPCQALPWNTSMDNGTRRSTMVVGTVECHSCSSCWRLPGPRGPPHQRPGHRWNGTAQPASRRLRPAAGPSASSLFRPQTPQGRCPTQSCTRPLWSSPRRCPHPPCLIAAPRLQFQRQPPALHSCWKPQSALSGCRHPTGWGSRRSAWHAAWRSAGAGGGRRCWRVRGAGWRLRGAPRKAPQSCGRSSARRTAAAVRPCGCCAQASPGRAPSAGSYPAAACPLHSAPKPCDSNINTALICSLVARITCKLSFQRGSIVCAVQVRGLVYTIGEAHLQRHLDYW